ncbi:hypothetical protein [Vibrio sp. 10N]|uniref:hypothetical protein n=1 Tax=Vibrio sp. 10N TaxID=3058938 RepID=UPI002812BD2F|nr:hypothetical protein VB10N_39980 [Vibrio sp. 10N]
MHAVRTTLITSIAISLGACGGGDGGEGGGATPAPQLSYQGKTTPAIVTIDNMAEVSQALSLLSSNQSPITDSISVSTQSAVSVQTNVDEDFGCAFGFGRITGSVDPSTYTGTVTATFEACDVDGSGQAVFDGSYTVDVEAVNTNTLSLVNSTITFNDFKTSSNDGNYVSLTGQLIERGANTCQHTTTQNLVSNSNQPSLNRYLKNVKTTRSCVSDDSVGSNLTKYSISGRYYLADLGYLDLRSEDVIIANQVVFEQVDLGLTDVIAQGTLELFNEASSLRYVGKAEAIGGTFNRYDYRTRIRLEEVTSNTEIVDVDIPSWMAVTPELLDFKDSDGDKMWDGYERYYGLEPYVNDADEDFDSDGFSNYIEWLVDSNPSSSSLMPTGYVGISYTPFDVSGDAGTPLKVDFTISGGFDARYAAVVGTFSVVANLPEGAGEWQLKSDLGCVINSSNQIYCGNLSAQDFPIDADGQAIDKPFLELTLFSAQPSTSCVNFQVVTKNPIVIDLTGVCYTVY